MRMLRKLTVLGVASIAALAALIPGAASAEDVVTIYSADGLHDGTPNWYQTQFDAFTKATGIKVQYVEAGSGGIVERVSKESTNPQADVLVTLPPFIMKAKADGLLHAHTPAGADQIAAEQKDSGGMYAALCNNYMNFIYNSATLKEAPKSFSDLLDPKFGGKVQYSTPGQAGDDTAVMIQVFHAFGGKDKGFEFLKALQANNVGPSASTGKLTALVNKGELFVANGDVQMNVDQMRTNPNIKVFWPAGPDGERSTFALPYYVGLVKGAPHSEAGKKLIDFLLSNDAQAKLPAMAFGIPVRKDVVASDEHYKAIHGLMEGVTVWTPDWAQVLKDLKDDVAKWHEVTGS
jgi:2-aminoethylphosphonate transport system substrate-binding protein